MECVSRPFGQLSTGVEVVAHTLTNSKGHSLTVLNYGGIIQSLCMPDAGGNVANVVLGFNSAKEYEELSPYYGCITGRTAGRISGGGFEIDGQRYELVSEDGVNLHGGPIGLDKRVWEVAEVITATYGELVLSYTSAHMDQGFPGELDMIITYKLDDEDALTITYKATTDASTILTLTNHSYFNLSGDLSTNILDNELTLPADKVLAIGSDSIPVGIDDVADGPFDFRCGKTIGQDIDAETDNIKNGSGYDHPFVLNKEDGEEIQLFDPKSGRRMTVITSEQCVVCYTANFLEKSMYVFDKTYLQPRGAICLETQYYPDAINAEFLGSRLLKPGEIYLEETTFKFSVN